MSELATLGGGCFWCLEAVFHRMDGVESAISGYMGGHVDQPTYRQVCEGTTGHAEVVQIRFDPAITSYGDLLDVFFAIHDPTTLNRQGNDAGPQYRSAIYFHDESQRSQALAKIGAIAAEWPHPIVTEVTPTGRFWPAEEYHQDYFTHNGSQPYCAFVVAPKVAKFRKQFAGKWKG
jgi:peptide-methionine (S)-S-oxide reductase